MDKVEKFFLLSGVAVLIVAAGSAQATQSHPFSELVPGGSDLDFGGQAAKDVSKVTWYNNDNNGLIVEEDKLYQKGGLMELHPGDAEWNFTVDDGNPPIMTIDESEGVKIPNGDLNVTGDINVTGNVNTGNCIGDQC